MRSSRGRLFSGVVGLLLVLPRAVAGEGDAAMKVKKLKPVIAGSPETIPMDINNRGQAAGYFFDGDTMGEYRAVLWNKKGTPKRLACFEGDRSCQAWAVNDLGVAVGYRDDQNFAGAVVWGEDGKIRALPTPAGKIDAWANDINETGWITGGAWGWDGKRRPYLWRVGDPPKKLRPLRGYPDSQGEAITDFEGTKRPIVGWGMDEAWEHWQAVSWDRKGKPRALPPLPGHSDSWAIGINRKGEVVGGSEGAGKTSLAVVWGKDRQPRALMVLGVGSCQAIDINDAGFAVGGCDLSPSMGNRKARPIIWDPDGTATELSKPAGVTGCWAISINAQGDIVGAGWVGDDRVPIVWR